MNLKQTIATTAAVALLIWACGDVPAGSEGGGSAGNNQPDAGLMEQCLVPQPLHTRWVAYEVQADGLTYTASAYLMDGECDVIGLDADVLKVTLVAIDSRGSRMEPRLNSSPQHSPFGATVLFPLPTQYSLELVATGNMDRNAVKDSEALFVGCALIPVGNGKGPVDVQLADIGGGKGKVQCRIAA